MNSRRTLMAGIAALAAGFIMALPLRAEPAQNWDEVVAAAKKEGGLTLYSTVAGSPQTHKIMALFQQRYGIPITYLDGRPSEIQERLRTELATGRPKADILLTGANAFNVLHSWGAFQPHGEVPNIGKLTLDTVNDEDVPVYINCYGLEINTKLVPAAEEPKSWFDLLDPKWKGKMLSDSMSAPGAAQTWFSVTNHAFGSDFHRKLAKQDLTYSRETRENERRLARGEFAIYVPFTLGDIAAYEGLPVKPIVPQEGVPYTPFSVALIKGATHPNAARVLLNFYLDPEAQLVYASDGFPPSTGGLGDKVPEKWRWLINAKRLGHQSADLAQHKKNMQLAQEIYGKQ